jgi:hypothetical protein
MIGRPAALLMPMPADQSARQNRISGDADPEFSAGRQDHLFDTWRYQRIFNLRIGDGVHLRGPTDCLDAYFRKTDVAHISGLYEFCDSAHHLFDRHRRIEARGTRNVDVIQAQALQGIAHKILHRRRPTIVAEPGAPRILQGSKFDADDCPIAVASLERFASSSSLWPIP